MKLDAEDLSVRHGETVVHLLPREFELLQFLVDNHTRVFSRDQLLDAVWRGESPVDRTVDDHIYRLRKKLNSALPPFPVSIETARGRGYRLRLHSLSSTETKPQVQSVGWRTDEYKSQLRDMFFHYVRAGHGAGVRALAGQTEVFGLNADKELLLYARFQSGQFEQIVSNAEIPFERRLPWMLFLYGSVQRDVSRSLRLHEYIVDSYLLPFEHHREVICFQLPMLYLRTGNVEEGCRLTQDAIMMSDVMDWEGYIPAIRLADVMCDIYRMDLEGATRKLEYARHVLKELPWQREVAYATMIEGYLDLLRGDTKRASERMWAGLKQVEQVGLSHHIIIRVNQALHITENLLPTPELAKELHVHWHELSERYDFPRIVNEIEKEFKHEFGIKLL